MKNLKIGDIFEIQIKEKNCKKYFQYIANDITMLNSTVVRIFKPEFDTSKNVDYSILYSESIQCYTHITINVGLKLGFWTKVSRGNVEENAKSPHFRISLDYGRAAHEAPVEFSKRWWVWQTNHDYKEVEYLSEEEKLYDMGMVINPKGVYEIASGRVYPKNYPKPL